MSSGPAFNGEGCDAESVEAAKRRGQDVAEECAPQFGSTTRTSSFSEGEHEEGKARIG